MNDKKKKLIVLEYIIDKIVNLVNEDPHMHADSSSIFKEKDETQEEYIRKLEEYIDAVHYALQESSRLHQELQKALAKIFSKKKKKD